MLSKYVKRFLVSAKRYGLLNVILSILKRLYSPVFINRKILMFHIFKNAQFKEYPCPDNIVFSELKEEECEELISISPYVQRKNLDLRLQQNHQCIIARADGKIIFHTWIGKGSVYIPVIEKYMDFKEDQVYFYNTYTDNAYASFNILPIFLKKMHDIYDENQSPYNEAMTIVDTDVRIPIRAYKKITGATKITLIEYKRFLWIKKYHMRVINDKEASALCRKK